MFCKDTDGKMYVAQGKFVLIGIISFYIMKMEMDAADVALTTDNPSKTKEILGI